MHEIPTDPHRRRIRRDGVPIRDGKCRDCGAIIDPTDARCSDCFDQYKLDRAAEKEARRAARPERVEREDPPVVPFDLDHHVGVVRLLGITSAFYDSDDAKWVIINDPRGVLR